MKKKIKPYNFKLVNNSFPGPFSTGPFDKINVEHGSLLINGGTSNHKKIYYRVIDIENESKEIKKTWVKINTHLIEKTKIEFRPPLKDLK